MEDFEIELELTKLMQELQKNEIVLEKFRAPLLSLIENINKDIEKVTKPNREKSEEIEKRIEELALLRKKSLKTGSGNITYVSGGVRRKWNLDLLDLVCEDNKYIKDHIWKFRDEDKFEPQVRIKVETKGKSAIDI